jgi:hypothetical protein
MNTTRKQRNGVEHLRYFRHLLLTCSAAVALTFPLAAGVSAQTFTKSLTIQPTNAADRGDGTMSAVARKAMEEGPRPAGTADVRAKEAANKAAARARASAEGATGAPPEFGDSGTAPLAPAIGVSVAGQPASSGSPPDTTGAIGNKRFMQLVNSTYALYDRSGSPVGSGTLNQLFDTAGASSFDPQVIWDARTAKFFYIGDSVFSSSDNRLAYGFSKSVDPNSHTDFCHYTLSFGADFPDFPKTGDTLKFVHTGVNFYDVSDSFLRSAIIHISKSVGKRPITACPGPSAWITDDLRDPSNNKVFAPVPGNSIDASNNGTAFARSLVNLSQLTFFKISKVGGVPSVGAPELLVLPFAVNVPPDATQPGLTQVLDTSDTRGTQAVLARNANRNNKWSYWTQQTVANGATSGVRWYEINPFSSPPSLRDNGIIQYGDDYFAYNAAISPDRQVKGKTARFGDSFVMTFNASGAPGNLSPGMYALTSEHGAAPTDIGIVGAVGPYRDFTCPNPGNRCRWGDYAGATPDPAVGNGKTIGNVWVTNQFSGVLNPPTGSANWRTWIAQIVP